MALFGLIQTTADRISALDLTKEKAKAKREQGWTDERADAAEADYRRFLYLLAKQPNRRIVPWTNDLDQIWHVHILDTRKYREDCRRAVGRFIDHDPHLNTAPRTAWRAKRDTQSLYSYYFAGRDQSKHTWLGATAVGLAALSLTANGQRLPIEEEEEQQRRRRESNNGGGDCGGGISPYIFDAPVRNPEPSSHVNDFGDATGGGGGDGGDGGGGDGGGGGCSSGGD